MPLAKPTLSSGLAELAADPPATAAGCAQAWADAVRAYAAAVVPASTTVTAAAATLAGALSSAFQSSAAAPQMETAFTAFAASVGAGMAPAFVAVPPSGSVGFAAQFGGAMPATHAEAGDAIATRIDNWLKTGTATPAGGGAAVSWS